MEGFVSYLGAWMPSGRVGTAFRDVSGMVDGDAPESGWNPESKGKAGCQPGGGAASGAAPISLAGIAAQDSRRVVKQ